MENNKLTNTHTFNGPFPGLPRWAGTRKVKPIWIFTEARDTANLRDITNLTINSQRIQHDELPSVLWRCWLGGRKGIRPVKNWVVGCWRGYLSGARCRLAYSPADATATHCLFASVKSRLVLPFWYRLTRVVPEKGPLNVCVCVCVCTAWRSRKHVKLYRTKQSLAIECHTILLNLEIAWHTALSNAQYLK